MKNWLDTMVISAEAGRGMCEVQVCVVLSLVPKAFCKEWDFNTAVCP